MPKAKKQSVVTRGNARIRGNRDVATAVAESGVADASREDLKVTKAAVKEGKKVKSAVTGRTAWAEAAADAKGSEYDSDLWDKKPSGQASRTREFHYDVTGRPFKKKVDQMTASMNFLRDLAEASEPSSRRVQSQLAETQTRFERAAPGPEKEKHRRAIGRMMQQGTFEKAGVHQLACQTPGCNRNVPIEPAGEDNVMSKPKEDMDVVCRNCRSAGDLAGREYTDKPTNKARG
jgi:hypothetical protein